MNERIVFTRSTRTLPSEIQVPIKGTNTHEPAQLRSAAGLEGKLDLQGVGDGIAAVDDVPDGAWVAAFRHEHFCRVV